MRLGEQHMDEWMIIKFPYHLWFTVVNIYP